jgi:hypothetical protein
MVKGRKVPRSCAFIYTVDDSYRGESPAELLYMRAGADSPLEPHDRSKDLEYTCCPITAFSKYRRMKTLLHVDHLHPGREPGRGWVTSQRQRI